MTANWLWSTTAPVKSVGNWKRPSVQRPVRVTSLRVPAPAVSSALAFPASYALAFKASPALRRLGIFLLITPFFTSYIVRVYSWQGVLSDNGMLNALFGYVGLGPFAMLNTLFGTVMGYLTLCLPLVILLQLFSLANVDRSLIEAEHNIG